MSELDDKFDTNEPNDDTTIESKEIISALISVKGKDKEFHSIFPINTIGDVILLKDGSPKLTLSDIIADQYTMLDLTLREDLNNLYFDTIALHGGSFQLSNSRYVTLENDSFSMIVTNNVPLSNTYIII